jgi:hypothetical protein
MKITDVITEAANSAQQAAKAISMKKAGKKPRQGVAEDSSENKYSNLSNRGVNRGINRAADDFDRMMDLDQVQSPHYKTQHQQDTKQRLKTKPMAGPKGVLPEQGVAEAGYPEVDHMPGAIRHDLAKKMRDSSCKRCHGHGTLWKAPDGTILPANNVPGAKRYKCGACDGIGMAKQGVAEEASPMIKPPANRFDNKQEAFDYAKEHGGKVFKSTYIDPNTGIKNIIFVVKKEQGVAEGSGPKEKQKTPYRDINSPEYRAAADKQKQRMAKDKAAEPGKKLLAKKGVAEHTELAEEFDLIESIVEMIAEHNGVDAEVVWADLESLTEDELYVFAVTSDPLMEDWQKANKRDRTDGMSQKAVNAYRRENPGSKLKTAVTTKPSKLKKGGKASKRRKSYCSRSRGQMKMHSISCAKTPDKAICKARRRWNC